MNLTSARNTMIHTQIRPENVTNTKIHDAMTHIRREHFIPETQQNLAYAETQIKTSPGRWLWPPRLFAKMLQAVKISPDDDVLDIAPGCGYSSAVLGQLASRVTGLEENHELAANANARLRRANISNVHIHTGKLKQGLPELGPFNLIWINGAVSSIPWFEQLGTGGQMLVPMLTEQGLPQMRLYIKTKHGMAQHTLSETAPPPLPGFETPTQFAFP